MSLAEGWIRTSLGDVLNFQRGIDITRATQRDGDIPVVSSGGIGSYHDKAGAIGPGVVIGRKGTLGKVFYLPGDYWPHDTTLWVQDFKGSLPRFVYYFMSQFDTTWLDAGSANPTLNRNHLHPLKIVWPPLRDQQAIAEVLGALDDKIAANTKLAATADEFLSAHLSGALESGYEEVRLGEVARVNAETVKPAHDGSLRYIDIASVGVGNHDFPELSPWDDAPSRARRKVRKGDTLWSTVRPNRRSHSLNLSEDQLLVGSTGLAVLSPKIVGFAYLYEVTKRPEFTAYLENVAEGSAYPAVRADRFSEAMIPLLPKAELDVFEALAAPIRGHIYSLSVENQTLSATRDALLPQLMSSKLCVKDAEALVSAAV